MAKIKIKNFGPIKVGLIGPDEYINIKKTTVFIGNQGSGKSTIAKLISIFSWLEKAFIKHEIEKKVDYTISDFIEYFEYQNISDYFITGKDSYSSTEIEYIGEAMKFHLHMDKVTIEIYKNEKNQIPKIMYVPSERNLLSAVENVRDLKGLPRAFETFADEFFKALAKLEDDVLLPVNKITYEYDHQKKISYIKDEGYRLKLTNASSGFQALVPLYIVSLYLTKLVKEIKEINNIASFLKSEYFSMNEKLSIKKEFDDNFRKKFTDNMIDFIKNDLLIDIDKIIKDKKLTKIKKNNVEKTIKINIEKKLELLSFEAIEQYKYSYLLNIVEEPEQNLYPSSQRKMINSLLEFNNETEENKLIITTHSPYLINYLTLAVKGKMVEDSIGNKNIEKEKLYQIVPKKSLIKGKELIIYELNELKGSIQKLESYKGMPSDENELNMELGEFNEDYASLLEIEDI